MLAILALSALLSSTGVTADIVENPLPEADLEAKLLEAPDSARPGEVWTTRGRVQNHGPAIAQQVTVVVKAGVTRCEWKIDAFQVGESQEFSCEGSFPVHSPTYLVTASIAAGSQTYDHLYLNDVDFKYVRAITPPDLFVSAAPLAIPEPGLPYRTRVYYDNKAQTTATGVAIVIDAPAGFGALPTFCTASGNRATCNVGTLERPKDGEEAKPDSFELEVIAPDASAQEFNVITTIGGAEQEARAVDNIHRATQRTYRTFDVTTTADAGSGSLRAAMEAANAACTDAIPCLIAFRIPGGGLAWHRIVPTSPLPRLVNRVFVDGSTQAGHFGDTNAAGPEVEINGAALNAGNGFEVQCEAEIRGLSVNGFPDNGIAVLGGEGCAQPAETVATRIIRDNYIGVDPSGKRAIANTRGVRINETGWVIDGNIISGNTRAGVFVSSGVTHIRNNRIGLDADNQPLGNGAAGVFIGGAASGSDVSSNYIGFNHEFGVAIAGDSNYVSANKNSMQGNYQQGIDWGLDANPLTTKVALPEITSVRFENGHTIVEGTTTGAGTFHPVVTVYANDAPDPSGYGEGQYVLGEVRAEFDPHNTEQPMHFKFESPNDVRGKWITATVTHEFYNGFLRKAPPVGSNDSTGWGFYTTTSEFSRAVELK